jgi:nucleoside-diphosphate-sugar epimerase
MSDYGTVVVTGAGGFIGGRAVEILHASGQARVRALVRRWSTAARIGRTPVEIVRADVTDVTALAAVMEGADGVLHCARADGRVNVEGTRATLEAARRAGVRRVVHLSTIEVYGNASGTVTEDAEPRTTGREYGDSKIQAEAVCREAVANGQEVVILRPTVVYGPFSDLWTVEFAQRFRSGPFLPKSDCRGVCNLVYIDDVVGAMLRALVADGVAGEAFNVNGPDRVTWNDYFEALNGALGNPPLRRESAARARVRAGLMQPVRKSAKLVLKRFQKPIMAIYQRSRIAQGFMKKAEAQIRQTPSPAEFALYSRTAYYANIKASKLLGYAPRFMMDEGVALSAAWLKAAHLA